MPPGDAATGGRLLGVPLAVKDVLNVQGQPCTCGSRILQGYVSPYDATAIARLRAAGRRLPRPDQHGRVRHGLHHGELGARQSRAIRGTSTRVPGGSSGGSAAAVAADEALAALGTDTGGSIRQPASFCGCVGLKPSYGRVSRYGLTAYASSLDQIGPLTKDVRDAALLLQAMAGRDPHGLDARVDVPVPDYAAALARGSARACSWACRASTSWTGMDPGGGARPCARPWSTAAGWAPRSWRSACRTRAYAIATYYIIATAEASANLARFDGVRYGAAGRGRGSDRHVRQDPRRRASGAEVKRRIILGTYVLSSGYYDAYYLRAQKVRTLIRRDFEQAFQRCDAHADARWRRRRPTGSARRRTIRCRCTWATSSR